MKKKRELWRTKLTNTKFLNIKLTDTKFTGRKFLSVLLTLALTFGTCGVALAKEGAKDDATELKFASHGRITYQNGSDEVMIDSADFYKLAERLNSFKTRIAEQLGRMDTHFTKGEGISMDSDASIRVTHDKPADENMVDPLQMDFDTLLEGVSLSQSVPSDVAAATENNLTAGTAAWVGGKLIRGTGKDNEACYEKGKEDSVQKIVFSLYNNQTVKKELPAKSAYVSTHESSNNTKNGNFSYTSDPIYLYQDMDGNTAALNTISFTRSYSQHHGSGYGCHCKLSGNVKAELYLEDGSCVFSHTYSLGSGGGGSLNTTINLFDYALGDNTYCYLQVSGAVSIRSDGHNYGNEDEFTQVSMKFENAFVSHIPIDMD